MLVRKEFTLHLPMVVGWWPRCVGLGLIHGFCGGLGVRKGR